jgi:hypothetical protein
VVHQPTQIGSGLLELSVRVVSKGAYSFEDVAFDFTKRFLRLHFIDL